MAMRIIEPKHSYIARHICTKEDPWRGPSQMEYATHSSVRKITEHNHPGEVELECLICHTRFRLVAIHRR